MLVYRFLLRSPKHGHRFCGLTEEKNHNRTHETAKIPTTRTERQRLRLCAEPLPIRVTASGCAGTTPFRPLFIK